MADALNLGIAALPSRMRPDSPSASNHTLDASNDGVGWVFQAPNAAPITHVGFRVGARTGTPPTYVATLEGVDTGTGAPDGSDIGSGSPTAKTFTPPADTTWDGTWQWIQLTNPYTPTRGQFLAATVRHSSGTVDGSNNITVTSGFSGTLGLVDGGAPYALTLTAGSWAKAAIYAVFGVRTASTRYGRVLTGGFNTRSASTVGHRQALKFTLPAEWGDTFKVVGFSYNGSIAQTSGRAPVAALWSAGGVLQNVTLDSDIARSPQTAYRGGTVYFDESSLATLTFGTTYYIGLEVADATNAGVLLNGVQLGSSDDLLAYPLGTSAHLATFDGSSWSDDQTVRPDVELILADWTEPSGGGGGIIRAMPLTGGLV